MLLLLLLQLLTSTLFGCIVIRVMHQALIMLRSIMYRGREMKEKDSPTSEQTLSGEEREARERGNEQTQPFMKREGGMKIDSKVLDCVSTSLLVSSWSAAATAAAAAAAAAGETSISRKSAAQGSEPDCDYRMIRK